MKKYTFHFLKNKTLSQTPKKTKIAVIAVKSKISKQNELKISGIKTKWNDNIDLWMDGWIVGGC